MSRFCCINLKESNLINDFDNYNKLAREIITYTLNNNIAAFFNAYDYWQDIINEAKMKTFFLISDSFIYKSCELLDNTEFVDLIRQNKDISIYKKAFENKYSFFKDLVEIIFKFNVSLIEIYITEDDAVEIQDFKSIKSARETIVSDLFNCVIDSVSEFGNEFPDVKLIISR